MFVIAKLIGTIVLPSTLLAVLVVIGALLLSTRWRRVGRWMVGIAAALFVVVASPLPEWGLRWLEERFPPPSLPEHVDGIIALGGSIDSGLAEARGESMIGDGRILPFVILSRLYPNARLAFSGGTGSLVSDAREADVVERLFDKLGVASGAITFERRSRTTHENAQLAKRAVKPTPGETWLLVTSASHIPRAVGAFRAAGWQVTAYPVDYRTRPAGSDPLMFDVLRGLSLANILVHEIVGLLYYRAAGYTDTLIPGP
jgi:uncharacterized SAM-binding protein YcdF (DUF218 family)